MSDPSPSPAGAAPLAPVLWFSGLASFAAGSATLGIFFVTERVHAFSAAQQYLLGLVVGVTYTLGALGAGRLRRAMAARGGSARALLVLLGAGMTALMLVPLALPTGLALYGTLALYAPLTGCFWPLVEAYVSGGRRGGELRTAIGRFNIVWSVTLLPGFWMLSPLLERASGLVFLAIALAHLVALAFLVRFPREPGEHLDEEGHAAPASYRELLTVHRVLHATAYLVSYTLSPYLPKLLDGFGLAGGLASVVASTWLFARVATFVVMERWHGWHGRWSVAWGGIALVLIGFGATVLGPRLAVGPLACLVAGLFAFGCGVAALYTAALYYVFEVGGNEGGGSHEALIGLGYSLGPACGLLVCGLERGGALAGQQRDGALLLAIAALAVGAALWAWSHRRPGAARGR